MKTASIILALLTLGCLAAAIWAPEHNFRWVLTAALALIVTAGVWGTHLSRLEQDGRWQTRPK